MPSTDLLRSLGPSYLNAPVYFGQALDQTGQVFFYNSSSPFATGFQAGNATAAVTYTWPTAGPASNGLSLVSTTTGVMSWSSSATFSDDITITGAGKGLILTTPDGLHTYRLAVSNEGSVTMEQLT